MKRYAALALLCVLGLGWIVAAMAAPAPVALPKGFGIPADFTEDASKRKYWDFDTAQYDYQATPGASLTHQKVEGHLWHVAVSTKAVANNGDDVITRLADEFTAAGWTILRRQGTFVASRPDPAGDLWVSGTGNAGFFSLVLMQVAAPGLSLTLPAPQPKIEVVKDTEDLPYLLPLPGSKREKAQHDQHSFPIVLPGSTQKSYAFSDLTRWYDEPAGISSYEFASIYDTALAAAGWEVTKTQVGGDVAVTAHFGLNGRDIWLYTHADGGKQSVTVADLGAQSQQSSLKTELLKEGHIALYGIYFDTDSDVPLPASGPTLENVLQLLNDEPNLRLEVQGHTDNTGTPEHNATLSDARAASVVAWLTTHGIAPDRLVAKGYGATKPVADNNTEEGKAKNRRVEIADLSGSAATAAPPAATAGTHTALACTVGSQAGISQSVTVKNSSAGTLKAETIINVAIDWVLSGVAGGTDDCFSISAALAKGKTVPHAVTLTDGALTKTCRAYVSSLHPLVVHQSGAAMTACDPE